MQFGRMGVLALALALGVGGLAGRAEANVSFNFTSTNNVNADAGFAAAGQIWSNLLGDNITVNITAGFSPLGGTVLAQANAQSQVFSYADTRTALTGDAASADDLVAVANLPVGNALSFVTNERPGNFVFDNNNSGNNGFLDINRANAKALGLVAANAAGADASITFSSTVNFDFDRSNGIDADKIDFVAVAVHEIGHALGFTSGVDTVDFFSGSGPGRNFDINGDDPNTTADDSDIGVLDNFAVFSVLDLFRFTTETQATNPGRLDLGYAGTPFVSIDKGLTQIALLSSGQFNGDTRQASHWKDNLGIGIMDPTLGNGETADVTSRDLRAFDVIGFQIVPEPVGLGLLALGGLALGRRRRAVA